MNSAELTAWAERVVAKYKQDISDILKVPAVPVNFVIDPNATTPGGTVGSTITLNPAWFAKGNLTPGTIIHELVHAYIQAPGGEGKGSARWTEGIADAVRARVLKNHENEEGWTPNTHASHFIDMDNAQLAQVAGDMKRGDFDAVTQVVRAADTSGGGGNTGAGGGSVDNGTEPNPHFHGGTDQDPNFHNPGGGGGNDGRPEPPPGWHYGPDGTLVQDNGTGGDKRVRNSMASWTAQLYSWGIQPDKATLALMKKDAEAGMGWSGFSIDYYKSDQFQQEFPGIMKPNGTLKMTPDAYLSQSKDYQTAAAQAGVNLSDKDETFLFRNNVSVTEYTMRAAAEGQLQRNPALFAAFNKRLQALGMGQMDKAGQMKFLMGLSDKAYVDVWNQANTLYEGNQAGISFNGSDRYTSLGKGEIKKIAGLGLSNDALSTGFKDLANQLQTTMPLSQIQKFNLSKDDLRQLEFGGPRQAHVADTVRRILANEGNLESTTNKARSQDLSQHATGQMSRYAEG